MSPLTAFLSKPLLYLVVFSIASFVFRNDDASARLAAWARALLATLTRAALGLALNLLLIGPLSRIGSTGWFTTTALTLVVLGGFALWYGVARLFFIRTSRTRLLVLALAGETISGAIDLWAWNELANLNFC